MKITLEIEIEFESWFDDDREPKTTEEWSEFFSNNLMPDGSILGVDDGDNQDMIAIDTFSLTCKSLPF